MPVSCSHATTLENQKPHHPTDTTHHQSTAVAAPLCASIGAHEVYQSRIMSGPGAQRFDGVTSDTTVESATTPVTSRLYCSLDHWPRVGSKDKIDSEYV